MQRTVLAVDGHQLGSGRRPQRLHDRPGGDETLLVGEAESLAGPERLDRHRQPGEADDAVHHHVGRADDCVQLGHDVDPWQRLGNRAPSRLVGDCHDRRAELTSLFDHQLGRPADGQRNHRVGAGRSRILRPDDLERLGADRTGRTGDRHPGR